MSYPESVRYLYALGNELKPGAVFGLEAMRTLLAALDNPERGQRFVHVAGTNGKGSTCALLAAMLEQAGLHTGLYTSPHLIEPTERIQVDGSPITPSDFEAAFLTVHRAAEQLLSEDRLSQHPSYFETVTAMAVLIFRNRTEISVMEVGLGGRLDATNVITPEISVITPVSFDHEAYLGNTIAAIAGEKAGIIKPGVPVVLSHQQPAASEVILHRALELGSLVLQVADTSVQNISADACGSEFSFDGEPYQCHLPGRHQIENAATAILTAKQLRLPPQAITAGLRAVRWPGRLEHITSAPDLILDGAHNPAGAAALAEYIREFYRGRPVWLVYGAMRDKAIEEVTEQLFPLASRLIVTAPDFPRALRGQAILKVTPHPNATVTENLNQAIEEIRHAPPDAAIFFTGSLYLVGEARAKLLPRLSTVS